jgi:uncharacterized delta-60 repeat protein
VRERFTMKKLVALAALACLAVGVGSAWANPGSLDRSFSGNGKTTFEFQSVEFEPAVALQGDGKVLVAGVIYDGATSNYAAVRFNRNGSRDMSFAGGDGYAIAKSQGEGDYVRGMVVQPDGKFILVGQTYGDDYDISAVRFRKNGAPDTDFGQNGHINRELAPGGTEHGNAIALQDDGKIVIAADGDLGGTEEQFVVLRYKKNGQPDGTFGAGGVKHFDLPGEGNSEATAVALQPNGKIVVGGHKWNGSNNDFALMRLWPAGRKDKPFGTDGLVTWDFGSNDEVAGVGLQSDGKIILSGSSSNPPAFALARYTKAGVLDSTFRSDGTVTTPKLANMASNGMVLQPDDKIVLTGTGESKFALARYKPGGRLDRTFGGDGIVTTSFGGSYSSSTGVALGPDLKLYAAGYTETLNEAALARYKTGLP